MRLDIYRKEARSILIPEGFLRVSVPLWLVV